MFVISTYMCVYIYRVDMYKVQRSQQEDDIQELQESRNILSNNAEQLAVSCEECKEKSEEILTR
jgi:hypothetical protein